VGGGGGGVGKGNLRTKGNTRTDKLHPLNKVQLTNCTEASSLEKRLERGIIGQPVYHMREKVKVPPAPSDTNSLSEETSLEKWGKEKDRESWGGGKITGTKKSQHTKGGGKNREDFEDFRD